MDLKRTMVSLSMSQLCTIMTCTVFRNTSTWTAYEMVTTCTVQRKDTENVLPKMYNSKFTNSHESIPTVGYDIILVWTVRGSVLSDG